MKKLLSEAQIEKIITKLGNQINNEIKDDPKVPLFIGVMKGSLNFMMDLIKKITCPIYTDYIQISSYRGNKTSGSIVLSKDISRDCEGRTIVLIEDIIDTGLSMHFLIKHIQATQHPSRIIVVALFDKVEARKVNVKIDHSGYVLKGNDYLLGYGLDYNELCRNVPYVYIGSEDELKKLDFINKNR